MKYDHSSVTQLLATTHDQLPAWTNTRADLGVGPGGPGPPFCPGIFFFCKRVSDGASSFISIGTSMICSNIWHKYHE